MMNGSSSSSWSRRTRGTILRTNPPLGKGHQSTSSASSASTSDAVTASSATSSMEDVGVRFRNEPTLKPSAVSDTTPKKRLSDNFLPSFHKKTPKDKDKGKGREQADVIADDELDRVKKELESLRKEADLLRNSLFASKKHQQKQNATIEQLRMEKSEKDAKIASLESASKAHREMTSSLESNLQCQICIEVLADPYALAPCGHILCYGCLRAWFSKPDPSSTTSLESAAVNIDEETGKRIKRIKTCPCCRTVIKKKPAPVFLIRNLVHALGRSNPNPSQSRVDPWSMFFPESESSDDQSEYVTDTGSDFDGSGDDEDEDIHVGAGLYDWSDTSDEDAGNMRLPDLWAARGNRISLPSGFFRDEEITAEALQMIFDTSSESDTPRRRGRPSRTRISPGRYIRQHWEPPIHTRPIAGDDELETDPTRASLLRRGCTEAMINSFKMDYTHEQGIIAYVQTNVNREDETDIFPSAEDWRNDRVFLGWNVLLDAWDSEGDDFMFKAVRSTRDSPEKWRVVPRADLTRQRRDSPQNINPTPKDLIRLVLEGDQVAYDTTDSEIWIDC